MNISLIATHQLSLSKKIPLHNCLGILTLASCVRERNLECTVTLPDLSEFHSIGNRDYAEIMEKTAALILLTSPDVVGFSTMTTNLAFALELCRIIKQKKSSIITLLGGPGASFCAGEVLTSFRSVDFIIRGEADFAFPDFIDRLIKKESISSLKGLVCKKDGKLIDNGWPCPIENLDSVPIPAYDLCHNFDTEDSKSGDYNGICLEVGRGCPYNCSFCSTSHFFKRKYRVKSIARVIAEIKDIQKITGTKRMIFNHDLLTFTSSYVEELCGRIKKHFPELVWKCHSRIDTVDKKMLKRMREAGCNEIFFGIECATERMQKNIGKNLKLDKLDKVTRILSELGFTYSLAFITGFPEETTEDLTALLKTALKAQYFNRKNAIVKIHTLVPLSGSDLYSKYKNKLAVSTYGSYGTTDIPRGWDSFRKKIHRFPDIFSAYFFINHDPRNRELAVKLEMIGLCLQNHLANSLLIAYELLQDVLAEKIIEHIDLIELPAPDIINNTGFEVLNRSLCGLIHSFFTDNPKSSALFDAVSQFECALYEVKNDPQGVKIIETFYNPTAIIKNFNARISLSEAPDSRIKRFFMINRDTKDGKIKSVEINENIKKMLLAGEVDKNNE